MPSRFQIREAVVKFLYSSDLEGGPAPASQHRPTWEFVTESDRRILQLEMFRNLKHIALDHRREAPLVEFTQRQAAASTLLAAWPQAAGLKADLDAIGALEAQWSRSFATLEKLPKDDDYASVEADFSDTLEDLFKLDRELAAARRRFLDGVDELPVLRAQLEPVAGSIRRLQRVSDLLRMVEQPENFPEQTNLDRLRYSKTKVATLLTEAEALVASIAAKLQQIDAALEAVVENFARGRIDQVDHAILRLGTYEILFAATPAKVAINEAIQLAKRFGTTDSPRFVNGVLDRIAKMPPPSPKPA